MTNQTTRLNSPGWPKTWQSTEQTKHINGQAAAAARQSAAEMSRSVHVLPSLLI